MCNCIKVMKKGVSLLVVSTLCVSLMLPVLAFAYGSGGGGGGGSGDKPEDNRVFDDGPPALPDFSDFYDPHSYIDVNPALPQQPVVLTDLDYDWNNFWDDHGEEVLYGMDTTGSIVTLFIPGFGWYKVAHFGAKAIAFAMDTKKQALVREVFENMSRNRPSPGGIGTGNTATK